MKKAKNIITVCCATIMVFSTMCSSTFAMYDTSIPAKTETDEIVEVYIPSDAPVGTEYDLGNGLKYKVIDQTLYNQISADVQAENITKTSKNVISIQSLSGTRIDKTFKLTSTYKYWHVAMCNNQPTTYSTLLAVFDPDGSLAGSVRVQGGGINGNLGWIYSETPYPEGTYTCRLSSVYTMSGSAYGKTGTTASDVIYDG